MGNWGDGLCFQFSRQLVAGQAFIFIGRNLGGANEMAHI